MLKKFLRIIFIPAIFFLFAGCTADTAPAPEADEAFDRSKYALLECRHYDETSFNLAVSGAITYTDEKLVGGVVPHHLLAGRLMANFFKTAAENRPKIETVIIIAPVHYTPQDFRLCTSLSGWAAPSGSLSADLSFSERFKNVLGAEINDELMQKDHSVSALIPFVKYYFPNASAVCLLISSYAEKDIYKDISVLLAEFADEKECLFVFSADFSHYQTPDETKRRDSETREAVLNGDIERISRMNDANVDSPYTLMTFINLMKITGRVITEFEHSNSLEISGIFSNDDFFAGQMTSYFVFGGYN